VSTTTEPITETARAFFDACETGQGWAGCSAFCQPDATFHAQSEPLTELSTVEGYADWMRGILSLMPDASYAVKSFAADPERDNVTVFAVFSGTHTGEGGPVPPTGKRLSTDYVYVMEFDGDKIKHMQKIWNSGWAMKQVGWA